MNTRDLTLAVIAVAVLMLLGAVFYNMGKSNAREELAAQVLASAQAQVQSALANP